MIALGRRVELVVQPHAAAARHATQVVTGKAYRPRIIALGRLALARLGLSRALFPPEPSSCRCCCVIWASLLPYFQTAHRRRPSPPCRLQQYRALPWGLTVRGHRQHRDPDAADADAHPGVQRRLLVGGAALAAARALGLRLHRLPAACGAEHRLRRRARCCSRSSCCGTFVPIYGTIWILLFVFVIARLSYGTRMTNAALIQIHRELEEAATVSGAGDRRDLPRVSGAAAGADAALCLAVDRAADVPRADARGDADDARAT